MVVTGMLGGSDDVVPASTAVEEGVGVVVVPDRRCMILSSVAVIHVGRQMLPTLMGLVEIQMASLVWQLVVIWCSPGCIYSGQRLVSTGT